MRRLWCDAESSFEGEFWSLAPCRAFPKAVQQPHPPIHIGGESDVALRRVVGLGAEWFPFNVTPDEMVERRAKLSGLLAGTGRSVDAVYVTVSAKPTHTGPEHVAAFAAAGADQLVVRLPRGTDTAAVPAELDRLATDFGL